MSGYLLTGTVRNALSMPSVSSQEAKVIGPWLKLSCFLGSFVWQITNEPIEAVKILYDCLAEGMNLEALNCSVIARIILRSNSDVKLVSAPFFAKKRGIKISTTNQDNGAFEGYVNITVATAEPEQSVAGTIFNDSKPRFIQIRGINNDVEVGTPMLYTSNEDVPETIRMLGQTLGENGLNIAIFTLGHKMEAGKRRSAFINRSACKRIYLKN